MTNKLISIIIPTFNRSKFLIEALESIKLQTYASWECLIIDDGSLYHEKQIIKKYLINHSKFSFIERPDKLPKGANSCRNYGFSLARGYFVTWFDDDDIMLPNSLQNRVNVFEEGIKFVISTGYIVDENLNNPKLITLDIETTLFKDFVMMRLLILTKSVLFKKSYLQDSGLFNIDIHRGQETEFFCRLFYVCTKKDYKLLNDPIFFYRRHENTKTTKNLEYVKKYKESLSYIAVANLERGLLLEDLEIISKYYYILLNNFFRAIEKKHNKLKWYIFKNLTRILYKRNFFLILHFIFFGSFFMIINRGSYKFEQYYKRQKININKKSRTKLYV